MLNSNIDDLIRSYLYNYIIETLDMKRGVFVPFLQFVFVLFISIHFVKNHANNIILLIHSAPMHASTYEAHSHRRL